MPPTLLLTDTASLLIVLEIVPDLRREPVEQVEQRRGVASGEGAGQCEHLAAGLGQVASGDALGGAPRFVFVELLRRS